MTLHTHVDQVLQYLFLEVKEEKEKRLHDLNGSNPPPHKDI